MDFSFVLECLLTLSDGIISTERRNAKIIVKNSTIYPFKLPRSNMVCYYCDEEFEEPPLFRQHMKDNHSSAPVLCPRTSIVKVDCTELNCRMCSNSFDDIQSIAKHLRNAHKLNIQLNSSLGVVPFVLPNRQWTCVLCQTKEPTLRALSKHKSMAHFFAVTCEECGKNFANSRSLDTHVESSHKKILKCVRCRQIFATTEEKSKHYKVSPSCWQSVCHICNMRFMNYGYKRKHMQEVHDMCKTVICSECGEMFSNSKERSTHFRKVHTDNRICCAFCPQIFGDRSRYNRHIITHTKERAFSCPVCDKGFSRPSVLNQHMWNHREEKRFKCQPCNKQFNQKVSWKAHMARYHDIRSEDL